MSIKVLLVDDEAKILALGHAALSRNPDCETFLARNGEEAVELCYMEHPDLVFLDLMMPKKDGLTVCREIKADPDLAGIKVVVVTAQAQQAQLREVTAAGADDYLTKPYRPSDLMKMVEQYADNGSAAA